MKIVNGISPLFNYLVGKQEIKQDVVYRPITFLVYAEDNGTFLVYNTLTGMIAELTAEEYDFLSKGADDTCIDKAYFIENWFLVPEDNDDYDFCEQLRTIFRAVKFSGPQNYNNFVIMTTTDCNARCFYCYQMGRNKARFPMSEKTAADLAKFIIKNAVVGQKVQIKWYGGEPLYNDSVIDLICEELRSNSVDFSSSMISNGYLFTEDTAIKARDKWNLTSVQIPIDGTEQIYNKSKAYIYKNDPSPYKRVLNNVEGALKHGISITVRVNMDKHNIGDMYMLADELAARFSSYSNFHIYCQGLYENVGPISPKRDAEERIELADSMIAFEEYCKSLGMFSSRKLPTEIRLCSCMADNDRAVTVTPDGKLGLCDHMTATDTFGDIYSDKKDIDLINSWKEMHNCKELCKDCAFSPVCLKAKKCPENGGHSCDASHKKFMEYRYRSGIINEYNLKFNNKIKG